MADGTSQITHVSPSTQATGSTCNMQNMTFFWLAIKEGAWLSAKGLEWQLPISSNKGYPNLECLSLPLCVSWLNGHWTPHRPDASASPSEQAGCRHHHGVQNESEMRFRDWQQPVMLHTVVSSWDYSPGQCSSYRACCTACMPFLRLVFNI